MLKTSLEIFIKNLLNRQKLYIQNKKQIDKLLHSFIILNFLENLKLKLHIIMKNYIMVFKNLKLKLLIVMKNYIMVFKNFNKTTYYKDKVIYFLKPTDIYVSIKTIINHTKDLLLPYYTNVEYNFIKNYKDINIFINKIIYQYNITIKLIPLKILSIIIIILIYVLLIYIYIIDFSYNLYEIKILSVHTITKILYSVISITYQQFNYIYNNVLYIIQSTTFLISSYLNNLSIYKSLELNNIIILLQERIINIININQQLFIYLMAYSIFTYNTVRFFLLKSHLTNSNFFKNSKSVLFKNNKDKKFYNIWTYIYNEEQ